MKQNHIIIPEIVLWGLLLLLATGCSKDWMEVKGDKKTTTINSVKDIQALLNNVTIYNVNTTQLAPDIAADGHYITEATWNRYKGTINQNRYTWANTVLYNTSPDWNGPYFAVLTSNVVLTAAKKFESDPSIPSMKGQAYFFRALALLNVATSFAPAYNAASAAKDLGIPLRLDDDVSVPSVRSTVEETYQAILKDLSEAINSLPAVPAVISQPSKPAALALLSRVYLYMGDFVNAAKYADQCLKMKSEVLDYNTIPAEQTYIGVNKEVLFMAIFPATREVTRDYLVDGEWYNLYDDNDLRKSVYFTVRGSTIQFKGTYGNSAADIFSGLALDEVYLTRAECYARADNVAKAMETLNFLMKSRYKTNEDGSSTYIDQVATNKIDALNKVLKERKKQLLLRGTRWPDLKRLNLDNQLATTITRTIGGETYTLEPNSYKYNFPIPADILQASTLQQNPGWQ